MFAIFGHSLPSEFAFAHNDMGQVNKAILAVLFLRLVPLTGCQHPAIDTEKLVKPDVDLPEIIGLLAGFGTTFAAFPDFNAMLKRRSSAGMNPRMGTIMGTFQVLWVYYGLLIGSRPVVVWNVIAAVISFLTVGPYGYFLARGEANPFHRRRIAIKFLKECFDETKSNRFAPHLC